MATVMCFILPGEFILLPKAALSNGNDFKTDKDWWVHLQKQSSRWAGCTYAKTNKTNKNQGHQLLKPSSCWAECYYTRVWDWQGSCRSHKKLQESFSWPCLNRTQTGNSPQDDVEQGSPGQTIAHKYTKRSRCKYPPIQYQEERQNSNGHNCHSQKAHSTGQGGDESVRTVTWHLREFKCAHPTSNHCYPAEDFSKACNKLVGSRRSAQPLCGIASMSSG